MYLKIFRKRSINISIVKKKNNWVSILRITTQDNQKQQSCYSNMIREWYLITKAILTKNNNLVTRNKTISRWLITTDRVNQELSEREYNSCASLKLHKQRWWNLMWSLVGWAKTTYNWLPKRTKRFALFEPAILGLRTVIPDKQYLLMFAKYFFFPSSPKKSFKKRKRYTVLRDHSSIAMDWQII